MSTSTLISFSIASLVLLVLPGPSVMYIVTRSAAQGRRAGLMSVLGTHLGTGVHVIGAMIGLSALLAASAAAFTVVKLVGAVYLVWLGVQALREYLADRSAPSAVELTRRPLRRVLVDGAVVSIFNPKTAIFFLSFVPQFVDPSSTRPVLDLALLGALFVAIGLVTDGAYALAGSWIGTRLQRSATLRRRRHLVAGGTYIGLGALTAAGSNSA